MAKRRRERDRPKAPPDASYDPNKRVLLSYASDDEERSLDATENTGLQGADIAYYHIDEYPVEEREESVGTKGSCNEDEQSLESGMESDAVEVDWKDLKHNGLRASSYPPEVEHQGQRQINTKAEKKRDMKTGQFTILGATPDLDDDEKHDGYDSTTEEAMAYLESVRSERQALPGILSAGRSTEMSEDVTSASRSHDHSYANTSLYDDEAFIGSPDAGTSVEDVRTDPKYAFTQTLKAQFLSQRHQLRQPPTVEALTALGNAFPISFPKGNNKAYAEWHRLLSSKAPKVAQVQSLEQETVFDLLALLQKHSLVKSKNIKKVTSSWLWSLLARLEEVGNMTNDQVFPLRELGKKAIFVLLSLSDPQVAAQVEALEHSEPIKLSPGNKDEWSSGEDDSTDFRPGIRATRMPEAFVTENTKATLDMILVVVGDIFGQRDLLEFRQAWPAADDPG